MEGNKQQMFLSSGTDSFYWIMGTARSQLHQIGMGWAGKGHPRTVPVLPTTTGHYCTSTSTSTAVVRVMMGPQGVSPIQSGNAREFRPAVSR
jgi:hypothetical protein